MSFITKSNIERLWTHIVARLSDKADVGHTHDDVYYTEAEIDSKLSGKSDTSHSHNLADLTADSTHRTVTDEEKATWNAKSSFSGSYNDLTNKPSIPSISGLAATTYVDSQDAATLASAKTYADGVKNDLLNGAGAAYDTLKELGELIDTNVDAIEALETIAAGKADADHDHSIADVTGLQDELDSKATKEYVDAKSSSWEILMDVTLEEECVDVIGITLTDEQKEKVANGSEFVCYAQCPPPSDYESNGWIEGGLWADNMYYFMLSTGKPSSVVPSATENYTLNFYFNLKNASGDMRIRDILYQTSSKFQIYEFIGTSTFMNHYKTQPLTVRFKTNGMFAVGTRLVCKVR